MPTSAMPVGKISIASAGYGFVESADGKFFIQDRNLNGAMDGDLVRIRPKSSDWRRQAAYAAKSSRGHAPLGYVDRVLERAHTTLVGMCMSYDDSLYIVPQDKRIDYLIELVVPSDIEVGEGDIVAVEMQTYPSRFEMPTALVTKVLGKLDDETIIEQIIAARNGIETETEESLEKLAREFKLDVDAALEEADRKDIRDRFILTIDPADAKDFDDALSFEYVDGTMRLGVHIADVSEYVLWGSPIDIDARKRATSTYFPGKVFPMIPPALSDNLCSLMPQRDRLAFTVDMYLRPDCTVERFEAYPSVIRSSLRLDYGGVQEMFDGKRDYPSEQAQQVLDGLRKVASKLFRARIKRGSLDFVSTELKVLLDDEGKAVDLISRTRSDATDLVEEAMILCNEVVAGCMMEAGYPLVYRVHEDPQPSSLEDAISTLSIFGYATDGQLKTNSDFQAILDDVRGKPAQDLVNSILLRSMKQAVYKETFTTHFGLASKGYCHFTSPIRRYPDLMAHRFFRAYLYDAAKSAKAISAEAKKPQAIRDLDVMTASLPMLCEHCSKMERKAERASREALDSKICEYMEQFVGERFSAIITDVRAFGFFVRLDNGVEGLVSTKSMDGWFDYDEQLRMLRNDDSARERYAIGQTLDVILTTADKHSGKIDFKVAKQRV